MLECGFQGRLIGRVDSAVGTFRCLSSLERPPFRPYTAVFFARAIEEAFEPQHGLDGLGCEDWWMTDD